MRKSTTKRKSSKMVKSWKQLNPDERFSRVTTAIIAAYYVRELLNPLFNLLWCYLLKLL
ncbi:MAG: hypothetical protein FWG64_01540 [Firmicutes bacterium]|nr:hypothetical protein [Bacillota bacterium]